MRILAKGSISRQLTGIDCELCLRILCSVKKLQSKCVFNLEGLLMHLRLRQSLPRQYMGTVDKQLFLKFERNR